MLASLVTIVKDLGVQALAEGIETEGEAEVCRQMGFDTAQGYYFGRPAPPGKYSAKPSILSRLSRSSDDAFPLP